MTDSNKISILYAKVKRIGRNLSFDEEPRFDQKENIKKAIQNMFTLERPPRNGEKYLVKYSNGGALPVPSIFCEPCQKPYYSTEAYDQHDC